MSDQPETLAAILAEMRDERIVRIGGADVTRCLLLNLADRIEAAAKREEDRRRDEVLSLQRTIVKMQDAIARQADAVNAASLREALENARSKFIHIKKCADEGEVSRKKLAILCDFVSREITAALAAPPRNCDVGTAEEQAECHERFCAAHYKADAVDAQCFGCPASDKKETDCEFVWGQLPFAPAEGGDHA